MEENIKTEKNQEVQEDKKGFRIGDLFQGLHVKDIFLGYSFPMTFLYASGNAFW